MNFLNGKPRDPKRIEPMLEKLEEAWRLYPDMRLGQLLIVIAKSNNLFGLEDDILYKKLQDYIDEAKAERGDA